MPNPLTVIRRREHRRNRRRRSTEGRAGRVVFGMGFVLSILVVLGILAAAWGYADLTRGLPAIESLPVLLDGEDGLLRNPTRLYDRSGNELLAVIAPQDEYRTFLEYDELPEALIQATLTLADARFTRHGGYQLAGWQDAESHPTLAQALAAELLLAGEPADSRRALRERLLAAQMTARYGREQVLTWYLNSADYGNDAYGVEAAAQLYLGKSASDLTLSESALLAAVSHAPALNPFDAPDSAEELRKQALEAMVRQGRISPEQATAAAFEAPEIRRSLEPETDELTAFINLTMEQLGERFDSRRVRRGGLVVVTTLDLPLQQQAACAVASEIALRAGGLAQEHTSAGEACRTAELLPVNTSVVPGAIDSASVVILDPANGQVLAVVGDWRAAGAGAYVQAQPAGTMLTPFIYLSGFTRGLGPGSLVWDIPGGMANFDGQYRGALRLRVALVNDLLPPAEDVLRQMGGEDVRRIAGQFGVDLPAGVNLLSDESMLAPLDAAAAYGVFANRGSLSGQRLTGEAIRPVTILRVSAVDGTTWADWSTPQVLPVVSQQLAYMMTQVLADESVRLEPLGNETLLATDLVSAVKVGRTYDGSGGWTAGYTPERVVVTHVNAPRSAEAAAVELWHALIGEAQRGLPQTRWNEPGGLASVDVCDPSGLLPTAYCPHVVKEWFLVGNEPIQTDMLYQQFEINRETGLLATVFTPPELVEPRVYLVVPAQAQAWAQAAGIPVPPTEYDAIGTMEALPEVHLSSPALFAQLSGVVEVRGAASGEGFNSYRMDYGQGLNPDAWVQIGTSNSTPVREGVLTTWDTSGLSGLYVLRLQVVRSDLRLEEAMVVVTISP